MLRPDGHRFGGMCLALGCLVLVTACGTGVDTTVGGAIAGTTSPAGGAGDSEAQDAWQAVEMDDMETDRLTPEFERRNPFRFQERPAPDAAPATEDRLPPVSRVPDRGVVDRDVVPVSSGGTLGVCR